MELPSRAPYPPAPDQVFDRFAQYVGAQLSVPVALVSFVDARGQNLPGMSGLPEPWATERWTPLSHSFCQHVVAEDRPLVIANANDDPRVADSPAIMELGVIAYAGMPIHDGESRAIGSLCAIDHRPREWSDEQLATLGRLAEALSAELLTRTG